MNNEFDDQEALRANASAVASAMGETTLPGAFPVDLYDIDLRNDSRPEDWSNPAGSGPYDLLVIGAGPGGLAAARAAVGLGVKVALIERRMLGGECMTVGCIPSKTLIRTSRLYADMKDARHFGANGPSDIPVDFALAMTRMRKIRQRLNHAASAKELRAKGLDLFLGDARFVGRDAVDVDGQVLRFKRAIIATGARPRLPEIAGLGECGYLTNETVFNLTERPKRLLVIGGGPLGCEMAQAFSRLGVKVIITQKEPSFLPGEEREAAQFVSDALARDGVEIHLDSEVVLVRTDNGLKVADMTRSGVTTSVTVDEILTGLGRTPNTEALDLERAGVDCDDSGIRVDDHLRTSNARIFAAGDVCLEHKYTHVAATSGVMAMENALLFKRKRLSDLVIPWCTYTDPEIAHVGLYTLGARRSNIPVKTYTILMHDVMRAVMDGEERGFAKFHVKEGSDQILGATIVARHAGDMINTPTLAIKMGIGLGALGQVIHTFPTQAEVIRMAGDAWALAKPTSSWKRASTRFLLWARRLV